MTTIQAKYLKDYKLPDYRIHTADLIFELSPDNTVVKSTLTFEALAHTKTGTALFLDGIDMELLTVTLDGTLLGSDDYTVSADGLLIHHLPRVGTLDITNRINPLANTQLNGLYVSSNTFCTQCEPHGFRRITYFLDRPDNLSRFSTTIIADKKQYPILLSNGNCVDQGDCEGGKHFAKWIDPFLKPSYLFALVAGNLDLLSDTFTTQSGRNIELRIYVDRGEAAKATYAMEALKKSMRWDEEVYGREYDLDIFMIVAVRDFNMGAMENKGLNIFNSKYILANPQTATDVDYEGILRVVAHEYFHNWSGNRVTCRDWFQLSLKEGFTVFRDQCFTADHTSPATKRIDDVNTLRNYQFAEDAGPMAHPVLPQSYIEMNNFYTVTIYEKGAELIRMMATLLGKENFRKGTDLYFERHDGQAVTIENFVQAMEDASNINLTHFRQWYHQAGTPLLHVSQAYDATQQIYTLTVKQTTPATPGQKGKVPLHIPLAIGLLDQKGTEILPTQILDVCKETEIFTFKQIKSKPIVSLLRGFSAPTKLEFDYSDGELATLMQHDTDGFSRYEAAQQFALRQLHKMISAYQDNKPLVVNPAYLTAMKQIAETPFADHALQALLLSLPSEKYVVESVATVDIDALHTAYKTLKHSIAQALTPELREIYQTYATGVSDHYNQQNANQRRLKNLALQYLNTLDDGSLAWQQFKSAENMTDSLSALIALINHPSSTHRQAAIDIFKEKWQRDPLVIDKWLAARASADVPNVLAEVNTLLNDPVFSIKNPNSARALIGGFAANLAHFHALDGSGYQFLADRIIHIDTFNPQIASRLMVAFTTWRKFDAKRRQLQQEQLTRIAKTKPLSKDLYEVVNKMLGTVE